jgi:uncharacterized RDD family membrane protein YckC
MAYCKKCGSELPDGAQYCPKCGTPVEAQEAPASTATPVAVVASGLKLAFWWERFVAWLIDVVLIGVVLGIVSTLVFLGGQSFSLFQWPGWVPGWVSWFPFFNFGLNGVIHFLYWMLLDGAYGQSFGKMVMRIKVTRLDGSPVDMGRAAVESVGKAFLLPLDCLIGWILYPRKRQRILNYISETIVVKVT